MPFSRQVTGRAAVSAVLIGAGLAAVPLSAAVSAQAGADLRMTVEKPHFMCESRRSRFSRVAYRLGEAGGEAAAEPAQSCCDGQLGCAQFLSTNTVLRPLRRWHS